MSVVVEALLLSAIGMAVVVLFLACLVGLLAGLPYISGIGGNGQGDASGTGLALEAEDLSVDKKSAAQRRKKAAALAVAVHQMRQQ